MEGRLQLLVEDLHEAVRIEGLLSGLLVAVEVEGPQALILAFVDAFEERAVEVSLGFAFGLLCSEGEL